VDNWFCRILLETLLSLGLQDLLDDRSCGICWTIELAEAAGQLGLQDLLDDWFNSRILVDNCARGMTICWMIDLAEFAGRLNSRKRLDNWTCRNLLDNCGHGLLDTLWASGRRIFAVTSVE